MYYKITSHRNPNNPKLFQIKGTNAWGRKDIKISTVCCIYSGEFHDGTFNSGTFYDGRFYGGTFCGGTFRDGEFREGFLPLQIQGSKDFVNIPDGETIRIGCIEKLPRWWLKNYKTVLAENGYTRKQIVEYKAYIDLCIAAIKVRV